MTQIILKVDAETLAKLLGVEDPEVGVEFKTSVLNTLVDKYIKSVYNEAFVKQASQLAAQAARQQAADLFNEKYGEFKNNRDSYYPKFYPREEFSRWVHVELDRQVKECIDTRVRELLPSYERYLSRMVDEKVKELTSGMITQRITEAINEKFKGV